jgi:hypothetical protein
LVDLTGLLAKLEAWSRDTGDFHSDRQLADEVLIATGWTCHPDPTFEGGVRWEFGKNPTVCTGENSRPHPVNSVDAALGQIPFRWSLNLLKDRVDFDTESGRFHVVAAEAVVAPNDENGIPAEWSGFAPERPVAICIAIVRALIAGAKP